MFSVGKVCSSFVILGIQASMILWVERRCGLKSPLQRFIMIFVSSCQSIIAPFMIGCIVNLELNSLHMNGLVCIETKKASCPSG